MQQQPEQQQRSEQEQEQEYDTAERMQYLQRSCATDSSELLQVEQPQQQQQQQQQQDTSDENTSDMFAANSHQREKAKRRGVSRIETTKALVTATKITDKLNEPNVFTDDNTEEETSSELCSSRKLKEGTSKRPSGENDDDDQRSKHVDKKLKLESELIPHAQRNLDDDMDHKYCYRHNPRIRCNKLADKKQLTEVQRKLGTFSRDDQQTITSVWSTFANAENSQRALILQGLILQCCFPQLSAISHEISHLLKIDFLEMLPAELALKILCYLDCQSLCNAAQVSTKWKQLADDDRVWRYMCEQHIDRKCPQCGWGLPLLAVKKLQEKSSRKRRLSNNRDVATNTNASITTATPAAASATTVTTAGSSSTPDVETGCAQTQTPTPKPLWSCEMSASNKLMKQKRPWKAVYSERYTIERHWRKGYYSVKKFLGHSDGVLCCKFDNDKLLVTGSYDTTIKIWNTETGVLVRTLTGHTMGVKSLVFDDNKLISGGLDGTIKVWNMRSGENISTYTGHREGVLSVDIFNKIIVSGSADKTIKVWRVDTRTCYTLRGHNDWVTSVKIHDKSGTLFSASDDSTIKLWDLETNECITTYGGVENFGHTAQVQCVIPFTYTEEMVTDTTNDPGSNDANARAHSSAGVADNNTSNNADNSDDEDGDNNGEGEGEGEGEDDFSKFVRTHPSLPTHLITASLDNTIKIWDVKTRKCIRTQFGHIEGVWSIAADTFRIISGSHDKSIKVWDLQNGQCMHTFVNTSSVSCVGLGDSRIVCGLENGEVKMYCFDCKD
jgi:F-box and WD-40 domain protein MET30